MNHDKLTPGERAVWAAVYADVYPKTATMLAEMQSTVMPDAPIKIHERAVFSALHEATQAVYALREALPKLRPEPSEEKPPKDEREADRRRFRRENRARMHAMLADILGVYEDTEGPHR